MQKKSTPPEERFWYRVAKRHARACWLWQGGTNGRYGVLNAESGGGLIYAHRLSYMMANGPIPRRMFVMHSCDEPLCVNPRHLSVGTAKQNSEDMVAKGRVSRAAKSPGEKNHHAKLTERDVRAIREAKAKGMRTGELATRYGVTRAMIYRISVGTAWRCVL